MRRRFEFFTYAKNGADQMLANASRQAGDSTTVAAALRSVGGDAGVLARVLGVSRKRLAAIVAGRIATTPEQRRRFAQWQRGGDRETRRALKLMQSLYFLTYTEIAEVAGLSRTLIGLLDRGEVSPSERARGRLRACARALEAGYSVERAKLYVVATCGENTRKPRANPARTI